MIEVVEAKAYTCDACGARMTDDRCGYCADGADMLGTTDGALAKLGAAMGLSHVIDEDCGECGCWRVELVSGFGDALSVPVRFCPMCGREL